MTDRNADSRSDEELAGVAIAGPHDDARRAAEALFRRYQGRVYVWCFRHVRDHERALDMAQDVMASACRALESFEGRAKFSSWLFAIARNRCISELRRVSPFQDEEVDWESVADRGPGPEDQVEARFEEDEVMRLVRETLDPDERRALWLRCYERMPVEEITRVMKLGAASGARGLLQTARRKLRAALERREASREGERP